MAHSAGVGNYSGPDPGYRVTSDPYNVPLLEWATKDPAIRDIGEEGARCMRYRPKQYDDQFGNAKTFYEIYSGDTRIAVVDSKEKALQKILIVQDYYVALTESRSAAKLLGTKSSYIQNKVEQYVLRGDAKGLADFAKRSEQAGPAAMTLFLGSVEQRAQEAEVLLHAEQGTLIMKDGKIQRDLKKEAYTFYRTFLLQCVSKGLTRTTKDALAQSVGRVCDMPDKYERLTKHIEQEVYACKDAAELLSYATALAKFSKGTDTVYRTLNETRFIIDIKEGKKSAAARTQIRKQIAGKCIALCYERLRSFTTVDSSLIKGTLSDKDSRYYQERVHVYQDNCDTNSADAKRAYFLSLPEQLQGRLIQRLGLPVGDPAVFEGLEFKALLMVTNNDEEVPTFMVGYKGSYINLHEASLAGLPEEIPLYSEKGTDGVCERFIKSTALSGIKRVLFLGADGKLKNPEWITKGRNAWKVVVSGSEYLVMFAGFTALMAAPGGSVAAASLLTMIVTTGVMFTDTITAVQQKQLLRICTDEDRFNATMQIITTSAMFGSSMVKGLAGITLRSGLMAWSANDVSRVLKDEAASYEDKKKAVALMFINMTLFVLSEKKGLAHAFKNDPDLAQYAAQKGITEKSTLAEVKVLLGSRKEWTRSFKAALEAYAKAPAKEKSYRYRTSVHKEQVKVFEPESISNRKRTSDIYEKKLAAQYEHLKEVLRAHPRAGDVELKFAINLEDGRVIIDDRAHSAQGSVAISPDFYERYGGFPWQLGHTHVRPDAGISRIDQLKGGLIFDLVTNDLIIVRPKNALVAKAIARTGAKDRAAELIVRSSAAQDIANTFSAKIAAKYKAEPLDPASKTYEADLKTFYCRYKNTVRKFYDAALTTHDPARLYEYAICLKQLRLFMTKKYLASIDLVTPAEGDAFLFMFGRTASDLPQKISYASDIDINVVFKPSKQVQNDPQKIKMINERIHTALKEHRETIKRNFDVDLEVEPGVTVQDYADVLRKIETGKAAQFYVSISKSVSFIEKFNHKEMYVKIFERSKSLLGAHGVYEEMLGAHSNNYSRGKDIAAQQGNVANAATGPGAWWYSLKYQVLRFADYLTMSDNDLHQALRKEGVIDRLEDFAIGLQNLMSVEKYNLLHPQTEKGSIFSSAKELNHQNIDGDMFSLLLTHSRTKKLMKNLIKDTGFMDVKVFESLEHDPKALGHRLFSDIEKYLHSANEKIVQELSSETLKRPAQ